MLGIAVLGAVFSAHGGYSSGQSYVDGMTPAVYVGAAVVALGAISAMFIPGRRRALRAIDADVREPTAPSRLPCRFPMRRTPGPNRTLTPGGLRVGVDACHLSGSTPRRVDRRSLRRERGAGQRRTQDVGGLGPEFGQGPVPVRPDPEVDLGDGPDAEACGHVDQQGQFDGVAIGQSALLQHPPGCRRLTGQAAARSRTRSGKSRSMIGLAISSVTRPPPSGAP